MFSGNSEAKPSVERGVEVRLAFGGRGGDPEEPVWGKDRMLLETRQRMAQQPDEREFMISSSAASSSTDPGSKRVEGG